MIRPPLDVEQAFDVVLAAAAHRSRDEKQREFGKLIVDRYFTQLRDECKSDLTAKGYLDNLIAVMASAVRALSVERDIFATKRATLERERELQIEAANRILDYSPLKEKGVWGKAIGIIGGSGMLIALRADFLLQAKKAPWLPLAFAAAGAVAGIILLEIVVNFYHDRQRDKIEENFPERLANEWGAATLVSYRRIMRQFLVSAIKIREEYYPELFTINGHHLFDRKNSPCISFAGASELREEEWSDEVDELIDRIVNRHFAFETTPPVPQQKMRYNLNPFRSKRRNAN